MIMLNDYLKSEFGCKVYKLALDGGFTCPNRDGTLGTRGCIFCYNGSGEFAERQCGSITEQIERAKKRVESKISGGKYIAYFQSFTNTYAPVSRLREIFTEAINHPDICALSVGTRPDCLPDDTVALLKELNEIKPVWVELGLQTIHENTAQFIRRGYTLDVYDDAVKRLREANTEVITHMIVGLPGETAEDIVKTAEYIGRSGVQGIKIQLLHVLEGTDLAEEYKKGYFTLPTLEEYIEILKKCLAVLPEDIIIHRITGDGPKSRLIAPAWSGDKKKVLNAINKAIK